VGCAAVKASERSGRQLFFSTVNIAEQRKDLLVRHQEALRNAFNAEQERAPFTVVAFVILPDHLHAIWRLPSGDSDYSNRWRRIKADFSKALPASERVSASKRDKGERGVWQRRFWEHTIQDEGDLQRHVDYIHFNPVKHGYVNRVADWPHSTFHSYVECGLYPSDWAGGDVDGDGAYGD
jgi:putative transposase